MTGQQLIDRMVRFLRHYVNMTDGQALVAAIWVLNTWTYEKFAAVPYLEIWARHKRSGKSTLAEMLCAMARGGRVLATVRVLSMVKLIEANDGHYVPFIEEAERFDKGTLGDERAILASGYRKGAFHEVGKEKFRTFCPKAFVLIGNVHDILRDRCIEMEMSRGVPAGNWTLDRIAGEDEASAIVEAWLDLGKRSITGPLAVLDPNWLISSRDREIWSPIFSLAALLRLDKPTMSLLTRASVDLCTLKTQPRVRYQISQDEIVGDDSDAASAVLRDVVTAMGADPFVRTEDLLQRLHDIDTAGWRTWHGVGLDAISLAALLVRFGVEPEVGRVGKGRKDSKTFRGYKLSAIQKAATTA